MLDFLDEFAIYILVEFLTKLLEHTGDSSWGKILMEAAEKEILNRSALAATGKTLSETFPEFSVELIKNH